MRFISALINLHLRLLLCGVSSVLCPRVLQFSARIRSHCIKSFFLVFIPCQYVSILMFYCMGNFTLNVPSRLTTIMYAQNSSPRRIVTFCTFLPEEARS